MSRSNKIEHTAFHGGKISQEEIITLNKDEKVIPLKIYDVSLKRVVNLYELTNQPQ